MGISNSGNGRTFGACTNATTYQISAVKPTIKLALPKKKHFHPGVKKKLFEWFVTILSLLTMAAISNTLVLSIILAGIARYLAVISTFGALLLVVLAVISVIYFFPLVSDDTMTMLDRYVHFW